jgi:hypothetical protein
MANSKSKSLKLKVYRSLILLLVFLLLADIQWLVKAGAETKPNLAILPFFAERIENPARGVVLCPLCKSIYRSGEIVPGSENTLTQLFYTKIEALGRFRILPMEKVEAVLTPPVKRQFEEKPAQSAIQIGKDLNVDFILVPYLFRFEERVGSSLGVEKPASVAFDLHLLRLRDGVAVWKGKFDETQKPLSENLLKIGSFFRRRASWLTAEGLSSVGMDEILRKLPGIKELEEK